MEGYVKNTVRNGSNVYNYVFQYKDHLGNNRITYTVDPADSVLKILEEDHYYPFGLKHNGYSATQQMLKDSGSGIVIMPVVNPADATYKYMYNGKELQDELGLNNYDFGARNYDPAIGRWMNIDPLAEQSRRWTPYAYAYNNPIYFVDPDGMQATEFDNDDVKITGAESQKALAELQASVGSDITLTMDSSGMVTYTSNVTTGPISAEAVKVMTMIDDKSVTVNVLAENTYTTSNNELYVGGAMMGNTVAPSSDPIAAGNAYSVTADQLVNPNVLSTMSTDYNNPGGDTLHEFDEAYQGAKISQASGVSSPRGGQAGSVYTQAHNAASPQTGVINEVVYDAKGNVLQPTATGGYPPNAVKLEYKTTNGTTILSVP
jgi:RHS repeat-associated protein